jgi:S1-C subfamily serine protease
LRVAPNLPASKAGLQGAQRNRWGAIVLGDVIIAIDNHPTRNYDELMTALEKYQPGDKVTLHFVRGGKIMQESLTLAPPQN